MLLFVLFACARKADAQTASTDSALTDTGSTSATSGTTPQPSTTGTRDTADTSLSTDTSAPTDTATDTSSAPVVTLHASNFGSGWYTFASGTAWVAGGSFTFCVDRRAQVGVSTLILDAYASCDPNGGELFELGASRCASGAIANYFEHVEACTFHTDDAIGTVDAIGDSSAGDGTLTFAFLDGFGRNLAVRNGCASPLIAEIDCSFTSRPAEDNNPDGFALDLTADDPHGIDALFEDWDVEVVVDAYNVTAGTPAFAALEE